MITEDGPLLEGPTLEEIVNSSKRSVSDTRSTSQTDSWKPGGNQRNSFERIDDDGNDGSASLTARMTASMTESWKDGGNMRKTFDDADGAWNMIGVDGQTSKQRRSKNLSTSMTESWKDGRKLSAYYLSDRYLVDLDDFGMTAQDRKKENQSKVYEHALGFSAVCKAEEVIMVSFYRLKCIFL